jgi:asparagine synthase (glutamine-hydrolysing)
MCGIAGIFGSLAGGPAVVTAVERMVRALRHRGPDASGVQSFSRATLGMARLAIIDLSPAGNQPMSSPDGGVTLVFNGEIFNFLDERARLEAAGYDFVSRSDTEVVLALYLERAEAFVERLRGMFAVAVHDRRGGPAKEKLILARDHFGIKPLLYAERDGRFAFGSEIKALLASGVPRREVDPQALRELLARGSIYQPRTILRDVRALPPGHLMVVAADGGRRSAPYWAPAPNRVPGLRRAPYGEILEAARETIGDSVRRQLISDAPLGAFLSGGLDSSLIVATMRRWHAGPVQTYSVGFGDEGTGIDETDDAALVAAHLGTCHSRVTVDGAEALSLIERFAEGLDQPSVDGFNSYIVSRAAASSLRVAVSGTGGDEMFAGYPWFAAMATFEASRRRSPLRAAAADAAAAMARRVAFAMPGPIARRLRAADFVGRYVHQYRIGAGASSRAFLAPELRAAVAADWDLDSGIEEPPALREADALSRVSAMCLAGYTGNQLLRDIDACSMHHSLEVRVPLIDPVVADFALSIPEDARMRPDATAPKGSYAGDGVKRVLMDIARPLLPEGFERRAKRGFGMPFADWLRGALAPVLRDCLSPAAVARGGFFDPNAVAVCLADFDANRRDWTLPWTLMVTELWRRRVLDAV